MQIELIDWAFIFGFFVIALGIGVASTRKASGSSSEFFLSGRHMPWWLLGFSMVATTFSTDTPNLVTDIVRKHGVAGNWAWWAFLLTGMLTVFVYAKLWRRSEVLTDVEFYEMRYSGKPAAVLRGFRALYLGVAFNIMVMAMVSLAAIKIGGVMLGLSPIHCIIWASLVTVIFASLGGLKSVLLTDFLLFIIAMIGAVAAAFFALGHESVGSLADLFAHPNVADKLSLVPELKQAADGSTTPESMNLVVSLLVIPLAVQWWAAYYPGAEPGGGGYLAQRMLAAKDENHATAAVLFFNAAHYALRPWPWIIVALASLVVFPNLEALQAAFPNVDAGIINDDLAYPAMLTFVPPGWLGLILASLVAAYMSTISTHLNWGSSYVVNDFYKRFIKPDATEKRMVLVGRISTVLMMIVAGFLALHLESSKQAFDILIQVGAGTGLLFILRWFWWRINAFSEITGMLVSFAVAMTLRGLKSYEVLVLEGWQEILTVVGITTASWVAATFLTKPDDDEKLKSFCMRTNPGGPGWARIYAALNAENKKPEGDAVNLPMGILCTLLGCGGVYGALLGVGCWLYGDTLPAVLLSLVGIGSTVGLYFVWTKKMVPQDAPAGN